MINNKCYKYRSSEYTNGTCINIGGYYTTVARYSYRPMPHCYYTSFDCRYFTANGQCYTRSSNHSQKLCRTIPGSYYNESSNTCYYYCTEMPQLGQCFAADNPSFTRETCALIDGVYAYNSCHYVSSSCPKYGVSNGQCYSNRSLALTCSSCRNIGGHYEYENGFCYYYRNDCIAYSVDGQCYSMRTAISLLAYSSSYCKNIGGKISGPYCYYDRYQSSSCRYYRNCQCYLFSSRYKKPGTCANIGGYYDASIQLCLYNSSRCPYYEKNRQCYTRKNAHFTSETCALIDGYFESSTNNNHHICYYSNFSCSYMMNGQCYLMVSSSYHEGTCASIKGYYSHNNSACYYNDFRCSYPLDGQCYDTHIRGWSKEKCDAANGNYSLFNGFFSTCYISRFYCRYIFNSSCYRYISTFFDCSSCRLLDGHFESGSCYHARNCSKPLFFASNGQCYRNQTTVRTAAECSSITVNSFYDNNGRCYFTSGFCSSGQYINCRCLMFNSSAYNADSCDNFGGQFFNGVCYYNSSYCPYYSYESQCYRYYRFYNLPDLCLNIGGHYVFSLPGSNDTSTSRPPYSPRPSYTTRITVGSCYYNSFNCSGFIVDRYYCYSNRSTTSSRATCRNIGGIYAYRATDGTTYTTYLGHSLSFYSPQSAFHCLYNTFNCRG